MFRNKWIVVVAAAVVGCSSSNTPQGTTANNTPTPDSGAQSPSDDAGGQQQTPTDDSGTPGDDSGPADDAAPPAPAVIPLPFYVSDQFVPTGFMGDSTASITAITLAHDAATCKSPRMAGAGGDCYTATWAPTLTGDAGAAWSGVYWQSPANNWGAKPGKAIASGAQSVSFYAAGAAGGETIQLCAGGINASGATATLPYSDSFTIKQPAVTLTTDWKQYTLPLQGASYTTVLGGFCWVTSTSATESVTFYIDDIQWQ